MSEDVRDSRQEESVMRNLHDAQSERQGVLKLIEADEKLFRENTLSENRDFFEVSPVTGKAGPTATPTKTAQAGKNKSSNLVININNDYVLNGWFPEKNVNCQDGSVVRKPRKDSKNKDSRTRDWRDHHKHKPGDDKFVFRHYRDSRKYIEQYRLEHACGATIHISKRKLSSKTLQGFPHSVQVYQVYSPSQLTKSPESVQLKERQQTLDDFSEDNKICDGHSDSENLLTRNSQQSINGRSGRLSNCEESISQKTSRKLDPAIIFKYKLAPQYVQKILQQQQHLQRKHQQYNAESQENINGNNESDSDLQNFHLADDRGRDSSAKQTLTSRAGGGLNLAPTKVTISSLPSVPLIVSQPSKQTPISTLAEKVVVNQNPNSKRPESDIPGGCVKTLENLTSLTGGDKQMWFDSRGRAYVSLATRYEPARK